MHIQSSDSGEDSNNTSQKTDDDSQRTLADKVRHLAELTHLVYPEKTQAALSAIAARPLDQPLLQQLANELEKKTSLMEHHGAVFAELAQVKTRFDADPVIDSTLTELDKQIFLAGFQAVRTEVETSGSGNIAFLEKLCSGLAAKAKTLYDQKMFDDGVALFEEAMRNAGYRVSKTTSAREIILHGTDQNRVMSRISLGTPEANPDGAVGMNIEVDIHKKLTTPRMTGRVVRKPLISFRRKSTGSVCR